LTNEEIITKLLVMVEDFTRYREHEKVRALKQAIKLLRNMVK
jgi:hypothetical protein